MQIPKTIHYCWFGRNPLPESALKCIESWKKYMPDYEIQEWNEDNFDVNTIPYTREAYERKKYAFVSDYARFYVLYHFGGVYFDTDVEVIRSFDPILEKGPFMGCERDCTDSAGIGVAAGLGLAAYPKMEICKDILQHYTTQNFINPDGTSNITTVVDRVTQILKNHGLQNIPGIQTVGDFNIYPKEYFCPKTLNTPKAYISQNTYSIHHYDASWADQATRNAGKRAYYFKKIFGSHLGSFLNAAIYGIQKYGFRGTITKTLGRLLK